MTTKKTTNHRLPLTAAILAALLLPLGTACHSGVAPEAEATDSCPRTVLISATVADFVGTPAGGETRAAEEFHRRHTEGVGGENAIADILLFVIPEYTPRASQVIYYSASGDKLSGDTKIPAEKFTSNKDGEAVMELELSPGRYTFLPIANSAKLKELAKQKGGTLTLDDLRSATGFVNRTFVASTGDVTEYTEDFPILGCQTIEVPAEAPTQPLTPAIDMERVFARIDLSLTTTDKDGNYLSSLNGSNYKPQDYRLTKMELLTAVDIADIGGRKIPVSYSYPLLPSIGEYTLLPEVYRLTTTFTPPTFTNESVDDGLTLGLEMGKGATNHTEDDAWSEMINDGKEGGLRKLQDVSLLWTSVYKDADAQKEFHLYLPSLYMGSQTKDTEFANNGIAIRLTFEKTADKSQKSTYTIPIHNEAGAKDYYSVRRNTIYDIDLTFYGDVVEDTESGIIYEVDTWINQPVDIPW